MPRYCLTSRKTATEAGGEAGKNSREREYDQNDDANLTYANIVPIKPARKEKEDDSGNEAPQNVVYSELTLNQPWYHHLMYNNQETRPLYILVDVDSLSYRCRLIGCNGSECT